MYVFFLHVWLLKTKQKQWTLLSSSLKALFNMEDLWGKNFELHVWCLSCILMLRRVNKQPWIHIYWNLCCYYQDIYDWISPFNKPSGSWFILALYSLWGKLVWHFWSFAYFHFFGALKKLFELQFLSGALFSHPVKDTDSMQGHAAQIF